MLPQPPLRTPPCAQPEVHVDLEKDSGVKPATDRHLGDTRNPVGGTAKLRFESVDFLPEHRWIEEDEVHIPAEEEIDHRTEIQDWERDEEFCIQILQMLAYAPKPNSPTGHFAARDPFPVHDAAFFLLANIMPVASKDCVTKFNDEVAGAHDLVDRLDIRGIFNQQLIKNVIIQLRTFANQIED